MRMNLTRDFYIPQGAELRTDAAAPDAVAYTYERAGAPYALGFQGRAQKPAFNFRFKDEARRAEYLAEFFAKVAVHAKAHAERKEAVRKARATPHTLKVGAILTCSWGYEQTNVDFYQVTRIPGPLSVELRKIASKAAPSAGDRVSSMAGYCVAAPDQFIGEPFIKRCDASGSVRIASYAHAHLWDGRARYESWYG